MGSDVRWRQSIKDEIFSLKDFFFSSNFFLFIFFPSNFFLFSFFLLNFFFWNLSKRYFFILIYQNVSWLIIGKYFPIDENSLSFISYRYVSFRINGGAEYLLNMETQKVSNYFLFIPLQREEEENSGKAFDLTKKKEFFRNKFLKK